MVCYFGYVKMKCLVRFIVRSSLR